MYTEDLECSYCRLPGNVELTWATWASCHIQLWKCSCKPNLTLLRGKLKVINSRQKPRFSSESQPRSQQQPESQTDKKTACTWVPVGLCYKSEKKKFHLKVLPLELLSWPTVFPKSTMYQLGSGKMMEIFRTVIETWMCSIISDMKYL